MPNYLCSIERAQIIQLKLSAVIKVIEYLEGIQKPYNKCPKQSPIVCQ